LSAVANSKQKPVQTTGTSSLSAKKAALTANERKLRAEASRLQKKRENHAKILNGVAIISSSQGSPEASKKWREFLIAFYKNAPEKLEAALYGTTLTVKRPMSDADSDEA
jgi:hypothetical protein